MKKTILLILCAVLLAGLCAGAYFYSRYQIPIDGAGTSRSAAAPRLTRDGIEYPVRPHLQTVLLIGTDSTEGYEELPENERNFFTYHQADFLMLLVVDKQAGSVQILQINRDTMTDVPWLDVLGKFGGTRYTQICRAFNFGDGGAATCRNTMDAVSRLLFGAPIDDYIQIPMSAIAPLNDSVGGVPVTLTEDLTVLDPGFTAGTTVLLTGQQAEAFVRVRMALSDDTNTSRMRRQRAYMDSFREQAQAACENDPDFAMTVIRALGDDMQSSMSPAQLSDLLDYMNRSRLSPILTADGELTIASGHYEFHADPDSLWELARSLYC